MSPGMAEMTTQDANNTGVADKARTYQSRGKQLRAPFNDLGGSSPQWNIRETPTPQPYWVGEKYRFKLRDLRKMTASAK